MARDTGNNRTPLQRVLYRWHRRIGLLAAILVLLLAVTGIMLSHATGLRLQDITITASWITRLYAPEIHAPPLASAIPGGWVVWIDGHLYRNGQPLASGLHALVGAAATKQTIAIASSDEILLLTPEGQVLERLGAASLPGAIEAIGTAAGGAIAVRSAGQVAVTDDFLAWRAAPPTAIRWHKVQAAPDTVLAAALAAHRGAGISLHRLVTDLHSGRFLGAAGPWLMDAAAIMMIGLAGSGFVMWWKRRGNRVNRDARSE